MALLLSMTLGATMLAGCGSGSSDSGDSSAKDTKEDAAADETDKEEADAADETEASRCLCVYRSQLKEHNGRN